VQKFLRHTCKRKSKGIKSAREFYKKERYSQLRRYAAEKLDRMLDEEVQKYQKLSRKQGHKVMNAGLEPE
jgi:hypothetical protein